MLEYSSLPIILADLALCVVQGKATRLKDYLVAGHYRLSFNQKENNRILRHVLERLLLKFVTSNIASKKTWKGEVDNRRVFYFKRPDQELRFFSFFELSDLTEFLFENTSLQIDLSKCKINKQTITLDLKFVLNLSNYSNTLIPTSHDQRA